MKARDYKLVRDGKYNRHAIMQRAWAWIRDARLAIRAYGHESLNIPVVGLNGFR